MEYVNDGGTPPSFKMLNVVSAIFEMVKDKPIIIFFC